MFSHQEVFFQNIGLDLCEPTHELTDQGYEVLTGLRAKI